PSRTPAARDRRSSRSMLCPVLTLRLLGHALGFFDQRRLLGVACRLGRLARERSQHAIKVGGVPAQFPALLQSLVARLAFCRPRCDIRQPHELVERLAQELLQFRAIVRRESVAHWSASCAISVDDANAGCACITAPRVDTEPSTFRCGIAGNGARLKS